MGDRDGMAAARLRWAHACAAAGLWCLPALTLAIPKGLLPYGLLLLASTLLVPARMLAGAREIGRPLALVAAAAVFALGVAWVSSLVAGIDPGNVDSRDRFLVLPWTMLWAWVLRPPRTVLWRGALWGLLIAAGIALFQVWQGMPRAAGWGNAIVFADVVMVLMVLVVFCRPPRSGYWAALGLGLGAIAIICSGTRGAWLGVLLLLVVVALGSGWSRRRSRVLLLALLAVSAAAVLASVPALTERLRLVELQHDIVRIEKGDNNSSAGARLERLRIAGEAFIDAPWTGVGFAHFDRAMLRLPECRQPVPVERCHLGHAHNDLAEWAATMGIPGILALLGIYGVPWWLFMRLRRRSAHGRLRGAAETGAVLVPVFALCGVTQSMFAHQTTTSLYAAVVGVLLGLALREAETAAKR